MLQDVHFNDPADSNEASYRHHPMDDIEPEQSSQMDELGKALAPILVWTAQSKSIVQMGQRFWVFLYVIRPDLTNGQTLEQFGSFDNKTRQFMDKLVVEFCDNFHIKGRNTRNEETRLECQKSHLS